MLKTLYAKLSLWLVLLLTIIGLLYAAISNYALHRHLQQLDQQLNENLARSLVADRNLVQEGRLNEQALKKTFQLYMRINPSIEIYLLTLEGKILSYSADPKKIMRASVSLEPIKAFLAMEKPYPLLGDDPRDHTRRKAFSVTPVPSRDKPQGYLYVVLRGEQYAKAEQIARDGFLLQSGFWALLVALGVGLLGGLVVFAMLTRRLQRLTQRMAGFEASGFTSDLVRFDPKMAHGDEIDRLGASFDHMAAKIREQFSAMSEQDQLRRRLIAQISHDLRTPLASIQGYMESLQIKGSSISVEERGDLVAVALKQGRRLSRMVEELFELAGLDARERAPVLEPCSAAELVHDAVQKYQQRAAQEGVDLSIEMEENLPLAMTDASMLERVFDNLIDNALTHTPTGGKIGISFAPTRKNLQISIADTGTGIPLSDLPHIFEPFFQGETGSSSPRHAGLGLAIAKRIMELLDGDIFVLSTKGEGSRFTLLVPIKKA